MDINGKSKVLEPTVGEYVLTMDFTLIQLPTAQKTSAVQIITKGRPTKHTV